ncbi:unnamed protein product [Ceutorhynchus assimilis]|uniref:DUF7869 domain-containing protein n=1 Tax=Ceutorhynchus assimilis TaxID=467358 RepID=A0A9N9MES0_9CUCU|nr:unnamed protein product [Ceutorhynchus assimilis]
MAGTRGRKILEMVYKINTTSNDRQNDETIVDLNQVPPQQDSNESSEFNSTSATDQLSNSEILKRETNLHQMPPEGEIACSTSHQSSTSGIPKETHVHQMPPEGDSNPLDFHPPSSSHQSLSREVLESEANNQQEPSPGDENTLPSTSTHQSSSSDSDSDSSSSDSCSSSEDFSSDDSLKDPNYNDSSSSSSSEVIPEEVELQKKRKRKADPNTWEKTAAKIRRNSGKEYVSSSKSKRIYGAKKIGKACTNKCRLQCATKIQVEERQKIFEEFWKLGDIQRQRQFILFSMESISPKYQYKRENSNRMCNNAFHFHIGGNKIRVCKTFFKGTLAITDRPIRTVLHKKQQSVSGMISTDLRGKHNNHRKIDDAIKEGVRQHINSIPRIESHYCRKDSKKEYIEGGKTVAELHRDYVEQCRENNLPHANYLMYFRVFSDFNISFFQPKKDMCEDCVSFTNASEEEKEKCRLTRNIAKCYVWDETEANRGVNEIGSCVLLYLQSLEEQASKTSNKVLDVIFYSDNCCGQQKNRFMMSMYLFAVQKYPHINSITHKFLVKGHSQNEGDSVHATIEREITKSLRSGPINVPQQYVTIIRAAKKRGTPYEVRELNHESFSDLKDLAARLGFNVLKTPNGELVRISDISMLRVEKKFSNRVFFKTSFSETGFQSIEIKKARTSSTRKINEPSTTTELKQAYSANQKIKDNKKTDLLKLLEKNIIPKFYSYFYTNL